MQADARPPRSRTLLRLRSHCSRIEQRLLLVLRTLAEPGNGDDRLLRPSLLALGLQPDGLPAWSQLAAGVAAMRLRVHGPDSAFVSSDELDLLAALNRLSQSPATLSVPGEPPLAALLRPCAEQLRRAGLRLLQRTPPLPGRRLLERHAPEESGAIDDAGS